MPKGGGGGGLQQSFPLHATSRPTPITETVTSPCIPFIAVPPAKRSCLPSLDESQRPRDVDASVAVVRIHPGLAEVVRRLEDALSDQPRVPVAQLCHEQCREPGDMWCCEACADGLRDCLTGAACWGTGGRSRRRRADRPHSPELTDFACAAGRGDANCRA